MPYGKYKRTIGGYLKQPSSTRYRLRRIYQNNISSRSSSHNNKKIAICFGSQLSVLENDNLNSDSNKNSINGNIHSGNFIFKFHIVIGIVHSNSQVKIFIIFHIQGHILIIIKLGFFSKCLMIYKVYKTQKVPYQFAKIAMS